VIVREFDPSLTIEHGRDLDSAIVNAIYDAGIRHVAVRAGVSPSTVSHWLNGKPIRLPLVKAMCTAAGCADTLEQAMKECAK